MGFLSRRLIAALRKWDGERFSVGAKSGTFTHDAMPPSDIKTPALAYWFSIWLRPLHECCRQRAAPAPVIQYRYLCYWELRRSPSTSALYPSEDFVSKTPHYFGVVIQQGLSNLFEFAMRRLVAQRECAAITRKYARPYTLPLLST